MGRFLTRMMCLRLIAVGFLTVILVTDGHMIQKRHDIINSDSVTGINETVAFPEIEAPVLSEMKIDDGGHSAKDVINNEENNNVNSVPETKVTSTIDVNNGIEQNYSKHNNHTSTIDETITNLQTNFTKDFSQDDSVKNSSPSSQISDKSTKAPARITTVSLKEAIQTDENKESQSSVPVFRIPSEKPKRLDTMFARSTERAVHDVNTSTVPVSQTTASILSTLAHTPRISTGERVPARISSIPREVTEKRAKILSEKLDSSSSSTSTNNAEASWSDLKTVGEVQHNNVTLGKSLAQEEPIKSISGKQDSEEIAEKVSSTERSAEDHEIQLHDSNSSRIVDVADDNSLSSFQSRPTVPVIQRDTLPAIATASTTETVVDGKVTIQDASEKTELPMKSKAKIANPIHKLPTMENATVDDVITTAAESTSESIKNEEITEKNTEKSTEPTTENETSRTTDAEFITTNDDETTIMDETTTMSHIPKVQPAKAKEKFVIETTTTIPATETTEFPTTAFETSPNMDENKVHHKPTQSIILKETDVQSTEPFPISPTAVPETDSTVDKVTIPATSDEMTNSSPLPIKPITTKTTSTRTNQRVIVPRVNETLSSLTSTTEQNLLQPVSPINESSPLQKTPQLPSFANTSSSKPVTITVPTLTEHSTEVAQDNSTEIGKQADVNAMIAIGISIVAVVTLILLVGFLFVMRKRQKQLTYGQRCRPIGLDAYSLDNISVYNSVRRKSAMRASKRAFGNAGFDDPGLKNNPLNILQLATFSQKRVSINEEFKDVPMVTARIEEVPAGCEDKNRYANVVPLPESRVHLKRLDDDEKTEYINANFVKGPKDTTHYYIACQAPLEHTTFDFWRMIWEQNSRVIIMATDLTENGIEKCAEYLPSSFVIDNHITFGDYQITLKNREVRDKYAVSTVHLKNACTKTWREITHFWYQWPENGMPTDEASVIAMLLEARSYLKMVTPEQSDENGLVESDIDSKISNGNVDKTKSLQKIQGPLTVHCSPGTGRTGTIIACDIAIRSLEQPTRTVDVPQIVYFVRKGRASAVQTREQYEFIYKVSHVYATKLTGPVNDN